MTPPDDSDTTDTDALIDSLDSLGQTLQGAVRESERRAERLEREVQRLESKAEGLAISLRDAVRHHEEQAEGEHPDEDIREMGHREYHRWRAEHLRSALRASNEEVEADD